MDGTRGRRRGKQEDPSLASGWRMEERVRGKRCCSAIGSTKRTRTKGGGPDKRGMDSYSGVSLLRRGIAKGGVCVCALGCKSGHRSGHHLACGIRVSGSGYIKAQARGGVVAQAQAHLAKPVANGAWSRAENTSLIRVGRCTWPVPSPPRPKIVLDERPPARETMLTSPSNPGISRCALRRFLFSSCRTS